MHNIVIHWRFLDILLLLLSLFVLCYLTMIFHCSLCAQIILEILRLLQWEQLPRLIDVWVALVRMVKSVPEFFSRFSSEMLLFCQHSTTRVKSTAQGQLTHLILSRQCREIFVPRQKTMHYLQYILLCCLIQILWELFYKIVPLY